MTINSIIVSPIRPAVFILCALATGACAQAPVKATDTIPKVDISALPFAVQPPIPINSANTAITTDSESIEQSPSATTSPTVPEDTPAEALTPYTVDHRPLPPSLTSLPKLAVTEQTLSQPENIVETNVVEMPAETATEIAPIAVAEQTQPTTASETEKKSTQAPETLTVDDDTATDRNTEQTPAPSVEAPPEPVSTPPVSKENPNGQDINEKNTASPADSAYDGCKIIRIYGNYISVSITQNGTEALLVSLDLPSEYNSLQTMVNYIAYADFEPASYYPYEDKTPTKIAELIRNGKVQCVLQES